MAVSGGERVLVLDSEILIAMEVAQMLEDALQCTALAASWLTFDAGQAADPGFDAIVMDCEYVPDAIAEALSRPPFDRVARVYLTTGSQVGCGIPPEGVPTVEKPIATDMLVDAVQGVLLPRAA